MHKLQKQIATLEILFRTFSRYWRTSTTLDEVDKLIEKIATAKEKFENRTTRRR